MNLDIEQIRGAVRVARPVPAISRPFPLSGYTLNQIEALCDEIERLRALYDEDAVQWAKAEAERDAALAECERLRNERGGLRQELAQSLRRELNTALAEQAWRGKYEALVAEVGRAPESI